MQRNYRRHKLSRDGFSVLNQQCTFSPSPCCNTTAACVVAPSPPLPSPGRLHTSTPFVISGKHLLTYVVYKSSEQSRHRWHIDALAGAHQQHRATLIPQTRHPSCLVACLRGKERPSDILALRLCSNDTAEEQIGLIRVTPSVSINRNDPI